MLTWLRDELTNLGNERILVGELTGLLLRVDIRPLTRTEDAPELGTRLIRLKAFL
ncbi:MAG: hypothetical protein U0841_16345 [Chloroflexia bacterium]